MILTLLGCHRPPAEVAPDLVAPPVDLRGEAAPTGVVRDGIWQDARYPFSIRVPEGWVVTPGPGAEVRVVLSDPTEAVRVEVRRLSPDAPGPAPRPGCTWDFVDSSRYRLLHVPGVITVATCYPTQPDDARVLGWYFGDADPRWAVVASIPNGALDRGLHTVADMLGTVRLR